MKETILELLRITNPKSVVRVIKNNETLVQWINQHCQDINDSFSKKIYDSIYGQKICKYGNVPKFKSVVDGYIGCGKTGVCKCNAESVSKKIKLANNNFTEKQKEEISLKRQQTNIKKYGVSNVGQTLTAIAKHKEHYNKKRKPKPKKPTKLETNYNRIAKKYIEHSIKIITPVDKYCGVSNQQYYDFECMVCNHQFSTYIDNGHIPVCKVCSPAIPSYVSKAENNLADYIESLGVTVVRNDKVIINPYELDIVIPELKIAFEYCGLYWHSETSGKSINYHHQKMVNANNKGYRLVTIFEDEWLLNEHIVKSRIQNILGHSQKVYARKCSIVELDAAQANDFFKTTHIQGSTPAKFYVGLEHNNCIMAAMSFGQPRYDKTIEWELIRYSSVGTVVGGASKLLTYFEKKFSPVNIVSYCDLRWGTGNLYESIGFTKVNKTTSAGYYYTDYAERKHRSNFIKKKLIKHPDDKKLTESQLAARSGWYRIGDCGTNKYIKIY